MTGNISAKADKAAAKKPKKVSKYSKRKVDPAFYWMTIPAMILVCIFLYLPFLQGAMYSFTNSQGYGDYKFIGFKNYIAMFQDARVGHAYLFTIFIAILITLGTNILGMFLAVLLNSKIAFKNGFRAIFFIPYTASGFSARAAWWMPATKSSGSSSATSSRQPSALNGGETHFAPMRIISSISFSEPS